MKKMRTMTVTMIIKTYSELMDIEKFKDRFEYVRLGGIVGDVTFGNLRYLNQMLYSSSLWRKVRQQVILRDNGFDLGHVDYPILGSIYVHHLNPITPEDILDRSERVFNPEFLISTSLDTHNALHYGTVNPEDSVFRFVERSPNDTIPWI